MSDDPSAVRTHFLPLTNWVPCRDQEIPESRSLGAMQVVVNDIQHVRLSSRAKAYCQR
jgi:hypothetical protein